MLGKFPDGLKSFVKLLFCAFYKTNLVLEYIMVTLGNP